MTRRDWESVRVQLNTGLLGSNLANWLEGQSKSRLKELTSTSPADTNRHEQLIGHLQCLDAIMPNFKNFVENQIRESKEEET